jgi:transcriptional regulator with XRE-family HTH domain
MATTPAVARVSHVLREARLARGLSIVALASQAGVSPRLVSDFELGKRPNVSLETALRLLELVQAPLIASSEDSRVDSSEEMNDARAARAAHRRATWTGVQTTLAELAEPSAPAGARERLLAVARVSRLAIGLQSAPREDGRAPR